MFDFIFDVIKTKDIIADVKADLEKSENLSVYVGIPEDNTGRKQTDVNNAELAYLHEHGSPVNNIPQREFLRPSIDNNIAKINIQQKKVVESILDTQHPERYKTELNKLGLLAQNIVKNYFTSSDNGWPPNKPATIKRKKSSRPLIDTAQLLNSILYIIRK